MMKKIILLFVLLVWVMPGLAIQINENAFDYKTGEVLGAGNSYWMYTGQDTINSQDLVATTGHDSIYDIGFLQIGWLAGDAGNAWNTSASDSLAIHGANMFWLWIELDSTAHTDWDDDSTYRAQGFDTDSIGLRKITMEFYMDSTENKAWYADSLGNSPMESGTFTNANYGVWIYEDLDAETFATHGDLWKIHQVRIPPCVYVKIKAYPWRQMREQVIVKWKLIAVRGW